MSKFCVNLLPLLMLLLFTFVIPAIDGKSGGGGRIDGVSKKLDSLTIDNGGGGRIDGVSEKLGSLTIDGAGDGLDNERLGQMLDQALDISTKLMAQINAVQQGKGAAAGGCSAGHA
uniref:Secreted protein n=1 Tax=Globodera rostochiensis TaxID=31243 RepID=A0A914GXD9_GLORO